MVDRLALVGEPRGSVWHESLALSGTHGLTQVGLPRLAELTFAAFGRVERDHIVAGRQARHPWADFHDLTRPFVAQNRREDAPRIVATQRERVGMADPRVRDLPSTSPARGGATSTSTISRGFPTSNATAARLSTMNRGYGERENQLLARGTDRCIARRSPRPTLEEAAAATRPRVRLPPRGPSQLRSTPSARTSAGRCRPQGRRCGLLPVQNRGPSPTLPPPTG